MDNNLVSALTDAVKALLPYAEATRNRLSEHTSEPDAEPDQELTKADDAISYAKAVLEVAQATTEPVQEILARMHGLDLPAWVYFSPERASRGEGCYWSLTGEWGTLTQAATKTVREGVTVPPDGVWIPFKAAIENTCWRAAVLRTPGDPVEEHFIWAPNSKLARTKLIEALGGNAHVTILRAVA